MKKIKTNFLIFVIFVSAFTACSKDELLIEEDKSSAKQISSFVFKAEDNNVLNSDITATINQNNKTITATVPYGTDISVLVPTVSISALAAINPQGAHDFSSLVYYDVTAEDGSKTSYSVQVAITPNSENAILSFQFLQTDNAIGNNLAGEIDQDEKMIVFTPNGDDLSALVPTIEVSADATISPTGAQNFINPVTYTVTADNGATEEYTVHISELGVLKAIYHANQNNTLDWDVNNTVFNNWEGVTLSNENKIIELEFTKKNLTVLPSEIGQLNNLINLYLGENTLTKLPDELWQLTNLQDLNFYANLLTEIPTGIGQLNNLKELNFSKNQITSIPSIIGQLNNLISFYAGSNQLVSIPTEIGQLENLEVLFLRNSQLTSLPSEIAKLGKLETLNLYNNKFAEIPTEIYRLINLKDLNVDSNFLTKVSSEIGQLNNLEKFYLQNNQLTDIPEEIGDLSNLKQLFLYNNRLKSIPSEIAAITNLESLALQDNKLTSIPAEIGRLTQLKQLLLQNNQLTFIPQAVCDLGETLGNGYSVDPDIPCK